MAAVEKRKRAHILRKNGFAVFRANRKFPSGFAGHTPVCSQQGEKQINNFFRLYVENRPALHGLHFSFVAGRSFPSSVSSADSFPSGGKPFFIPV